MRAATIFAAGLAAGVAISLLISSLPGTSSLRSPIKLSANLHRSTCPFLSGLELQAEERRASDQADDATNVSASLDFLPSISHQQESTVSHTTTAVKTIRGLVREVVLVGCSLPTQWVEFYVRAGLVFPVISLLAMWLIVSCFASGNLGFTVHVSSFAYCMVIAKLRFDDQQLLSACMHLEFSLWLVFFFFKRLACLPTTVLFFNGQLGLEGPPSPVNIRPGFLLTNGEEHLERSVRLAWKRARARAYARFGREQQVRLRRTGTRNRALACALFAVEQQVRLRWAGIRNRALAYALFAVEQEARNIVLARLQSKLVKQVASERENSFRLLQPALESFRRAIREMDPYTPRQRPGEEDVDVMDRYHPPCPNDLNEPQRDTDDNDGSDEDSHDPYRLQQSEQKAVTKVSASSFQKPAVRWKIPPFFPLKRSSGAPVSSGTTMPASSCPPSTKQQETPASSSRSPTLISSASSRRNPTPASSGVSTDTRTAAQVSQAPVVKPTQRSSRKKPATPVSSNGPPMNKVGQGTKSQPAKSTVKSAAVTSIGSVERREIAGKSGRAPGPEAKVERGPEVPANNGTLSAKVNEGSSLLVPAPIEKPAAISAAKPIEKVDGEGSVARAKEASPMEKQIEQVLGFLPRTVSAPSVEGQQAAPEVYDFEDPPEWQSDDDKAELDDSELPWEWQSDDGNAKIVRSNISAEPLETQFDSSDETDSDVEMDPELPGGRSVQVRGVWQDLHQDEDTNMPDTPPCSALASSQHAPRTTDESMDIDSKPAQVGTEEFSEDMDVDEEYDGLAEAMQGLKVTTEEQVNPSSCLPERAPRTILLQQPAPSAAQANDGGQPNSLAPSTSGPRANLSPPPPASSPRPSQSTRFLPRSDAGHHYQTPQASSSSSSASSSASSSSSSSNLPTAPPRTPRQQRDPASPTLPQRPSSSTPTSPPAAPTCPIILTDCSGIDTTHEERAFCSEKHPAAELCANPWCPRFSTLTQHWHVDPDMEAALIASKKPDQDLSLQDPAPALQPTPPTQMDLSSLDRPLSAADLPAQCSSNSCRYKTRQHWHFNEGKWVAFKENQALAMLKRTSKGKDKGKGKEKYTPPSKPETDEASDKDTKHDEGHSPPKAGSEPAPFTLTPRLASLLAAPLTPASAPAPAPTSSPVFVPRPAAHQDSSTPDRPLTAADLPAPCSSHSCPWTHRQHWHINGSHEVLTTEKQALTALKRKLQRKGEATCAPPPKPDNDESSDEDADDNNGPPPPKSGSKRAPPTTSGPPPSTPPSSTTPTNAPRNRHNAYPTPICDPENNLMDAEMSAYFAVNGPYEPTPTQTPPATRIIKPMRSARSKATISRLKVASELVMTDDDVVAVWDEVGE